MLRVEMVMVRVERVIGPREPKLTKPNASLRFWRWTRIRTPPCAGGLMVWPFILGLTEQMTYNGYLLPRFQVLCRSTSLAIVIVAFAWSLQHSFMPLTFDIKFMVFRLLSSVPNSVFVSLLYLRLRRLIPLAIA